MEEQEPVRVVCRDCPFSRLVEADEDVIPADVIVEHGRERGHTLSTEPAEQSEGEHPEDEKPTAERV